MNEGESPIIGPDGRQLGTWEPLKKVDHPQVGGGLEDIVTGWQPLEPTENEASKISDWQRWKESLIGPGRRYETEEDFGADLMELARLWKTAGDGDYKKIRNFSNKFFDGLNTTLISNNKQLEPNVIKSKLPQRG